MAAAAALSAASVPSDAIWAEAAVEAAAAARAAAIAPARSAAAFPAAPAPPSCAFDSDVAAAADDSDEGSERWALKAEAATEAATTCAAATAEAAWEAAVDAPAAPALPPPPTRAVTTAAGSVSAVCRRRQRSATKACATLAVRMGVRRSWRLTGVGAADEDDEDEDEGAPPSPSPAVSMFCTIPTVTSSSNPPRSSVIRFDTHMCTTRSVGSRIRRRSTRSENSGGAVARMDFASLDVLSAKRWSWSAPVPCKGGRGKEGKSGGKAACFGRWEWVGSARADRGGWVDCAVKSTAGFGREDAVGSARGRSEQKGRGARGIGWWPLSGRPHRRPPAARDPSSRTHAEKASHSSRKVCGDALET
jgi:hypothetical protein